ncbi:MAG: hypothetical protein DMG97_15995, partial [Acidobacteria bacterium]
MRRGRATSPPCCRSPPGTPASASTACVSQSNLWRSSVQSLDRLDIDTPEQIALELPLAGIGSRFLALAIDSLLQVVAVIAVVIVGALVASGSRGSDWSGLDRFFSQTIGAIVLVLLPFCLYWGYFAFFEVLWQGRTPGKRVAGIRVIHQSGRPMTAIECIGRNLMRGV